MEEDIKESWSNFLNPESLRSNLITASVYLAAFEILKQCIIDRPKEFYTTGFDENGIIVSRDYELKVKSLNKSPVYASLEWFKLHDTIDQDDINKFTQIKECRNELAHELVNFLDSGIKSDPDPNFKLMAELLNKIECWWIFNVEIPINPDYSKVDIDINEIVPGRMLHLQMLTQIALGTDEEAIRYFNEFKTLHSL